LGAKYTLNLGQLLQIIPNIKCYIFNLVTSKPILLKPVVATIVVNHQMATIQVQIGKNFIEDVLLDGGYRVSIITEKLRV
jgi:hypothetical protein